MIGSNERSGWRGGAAVLPLVLLLGCAYQTGDQWCGVGEGARRGAAVSFAWGTLWGALSLEPEGLLLGFVTAPVGAAIGALEGAHKPCVPDCAPELGRAEPEVERMPRDGPI